MKWSLVVLGSGASAFQCGRTNSVRSSNRAVSLEAAPTAEALPEESAMKITIPVSGAVTKSAFKSAAAELAKTNPIPGWRAKDAAKIPTSVVVGALGMDVVKGDAIHKLSETEVHSAISMLGIEAVGQAQMIMAPGDMVDAFTPGEDFSLVVKIDVWPDAQWTAPYDDGSLAVTVNRVKAEDDVCVKALEALRERYIELRDAGADYAALAGDVVIVDIEGYARDPKTGANVGPLPVQGAVGGDDLEIVLLPGKFLPGVTEALVGCVAGDARTVPVDFPEQKMFRDEMPLAGLKAAFDVKVKAVKTRQLPELNDEFAGRIRAGLTLEQLKKEVEYTVGSKEDDKTEAALHKALEKALLPLVACALPSSVVTESVRQRWTLMLADMRSSGTPDEQLKEMITGDGFLKFKKICEGDVRNELTARLAVESIARRESITVDPSLIEEQMTLVQRQFDQQQSKENDGSGFNADKAREKVSQELLRLSTLEWLASKATITYVDQAPAPVSA